MPDISSTSYSNWKFKENPVRSEQIAGHYASAESTLVCSGPPLIAGSGGDAVPVPSKIFPIGYLENFTLQQSKQMQRLYEIGSARTYFIPGRVMGSVSLGRVFYHGYNLLRVLYPHFSQTNGSITIASEAGLVADQGTDVGNEGNGSQYALVDGTTDAGSLPSVLVSPGENMFWLNLASDIFNQPHGLAVFFHDSSDQAIGASYMENCFIQGHQISVSAGSILLMEGCSIQYDRLVPIKITKPSALADGSTGSS